MPRELEGELGAMSAADFWQNRNPYIKTRTERLKLNDDTDILEELKGLTPEQLKYDVICLLKQLSKPLDGQITAHKRKVLIGKGTVSHAQAIKKAEQEFEIYRQREMEMLESDFDREIKKLKEKNWF